MGEGHSVEVMRIATWNCNGALRNKLDALCGLTFDIAVIQECEDPARCSDPDYRSWAANYLWTGTNKNRGLGVFARAGMKLMRAELDAGPLELFLPCLVDEGLLLVAVWTRHANSPTFGYIGQLWKFIQLHRAALSAQATVIVGDLNSNVRWDKWDRWWNHSDVVRELAEVGLESVYHHCRHLPQGSETEPTFFLQRNPQKPYHIDYAFAPVPWLDKSSAWVGEPSQWLAHSDHMPLVVSFEGQPAGGVVDAL